MKKFICNTLFFMAVFTIANASPANAAQESLRNIIPEKLEPGYTVILPDGRQTVIEEHLSTGDYRTNLGIVISPDGVVRKGALEGEKVVIQPQPALQREDANKGDEDSPIPHLAGLAPGANVKFPDGSKAKIAEKQENGDFSASNGALISPQGIIRDGVFKGKSVVVEENSQSVRTPGWRESPKKETPYSTPAQQPAQAHATAPKTVKEKEENPLTIAELLPHTAMPDSGNQPKKQEKSTQPPKNAKKQQPAKESAAKEPPKKTPAKSEQAKKESAQAKQKPASKPVAPGQALKIPPESIATGNLDFLEGCWQGTRPEYYSKRTIRECFCFGPGGKNGKRRIYDSADNRQCIGATRATLSKNGVLSVTSDGAACNTGDRWGSAEMVCRNSGPHTPCSWVFKDANNGRQSYEIPFVRVESCGR